MPPRSIERVALEIRKTARKISGSNPSKAGVHAEPIQQINNVRGKPDADCHIAYCVFQDEVPANNPGNELAHGSVSVRVGAAGDRNHGRQLSVADGSKTADDGN